MDEEVKQFKLNRLYEEALIPPYLRKHIGLRTDKDGCDNGVFKYLKQLTSNPKEFIFGNKNNLYIHSKNTGNGKTSWALRMVENYFNQIVDHCKLECKVLFIHVPTFLQYLKDNIEEKMDYIKQIKDNVLKSDLVIWDDIGTKTITVFESENLLLMIDGRNNLGKSNIFTSNLNEDELHTALGDRLYSRIVNLSHNVELKGADKRGL